mgnify:CR=1 FL=1
MIDIKKLNIKEKVELFKKLGKEIASKGINGDTELAHINPFEKRLLISHGGSGTINLETGLPQYFGGGGGGGAQPSTTTQYIREAPGIEERKLGLMDTAAELAKTPVNIPQINVQGMSALENQGITQSGVTGVGANTMNAGIGSVLNAQNAAALDPTSSQFQNYLNPYSSFVTDEINRQSQMQQNQISQNAVMGGAFGGGREGVQRAELGGRTLSAIGQAQGTAFQNALNSFQNNQSLQAQTNLNAGSQYAQMGQAQQGMAQQDINQLMAAGGLQRQLGQQALDATRQTELQRAYEPYQRMEFVKNMYAAGPTTQSAITQSTSPGTNPLAQAAGAGLGAYATYSALNKAPALQSAAATTGRA